MADRRQLAQGLMMMTPAMREDLAGREQDIQRGKTVELLRRAGKEMYENPIVNTAVGISPVLGDIQAGVEAYRSAQAGDWGNAGLNAVGMLPFIPMLGKTVWHGSPHTFDKFDLSKIGTGEGAQAYGHGLYLAEARPTAEEYAKNLSNDVLEPAQRALSKAGGNPNTAIQTAQAEIERLKSLNLTPSSGLDRAERFMQNQQSIINELKKFKDTGDFTQGQLYKVDLPDEQIAKMLDWDKPLSEQPKNVQEALAKFDPDMYHVEGGDYDPTELGQMVYSRMSQNPAEASQRMYQAGIPGIQYLDQGSRATTDNFIVTWPDFGTYGFNTADEAKAFMKEHPDVNLQLSEPTRNYVVFSDEIPQILERNGTPLGNAVRNFEAPKNKFDITTQDASDIFGEGASRIRYQEPNSQGFIDVLQRPDGTASVLGLEVPETARGKGIGQSLQQQVLSDFPEMQGQVSSKAAATTAHRLGRRPVGNPEATLDDVFRMIDENSSVNLVSPEMQKRFNFGSQ